MKKFLILFLTFVMSSSIAFAQESEEIQYPDLIEPAYRFSHSKPSYVTLKDGTTIEGEIRDLDRKKGLIDFVKIEDQSGKKHKLKPSSISHMYVYPNKISQLRSLSNVVYDSQKWKNNALNQDHINLGYTYFENTNTKVGKKQEELLLQLLNPTWSGTVKVYHDPRAQETASIQVAGIDVYGGFEKSYYIKVDDEKVAYKLTRKGYAKKEFVPLWKKCQAVLDKYKGQVYWKDLVKHMYDYTLCSK